MSTQVQYTMQNLRQLFKNVPSIIDMSRLEKITDRSFLASLEYDYQQFLETNLQLLDLYNFIDYYFYAFVNHFAKAFCRVLYRFLYNYCINFLLFFHEKKKYFSWWTKTEFVHNNYELIIPINCSSQINNIKK